jgi:ATP-dependent DNA helicase PIF1
MANSSANAFAKWVRTPPNPDGSPILAPASPPPATPVSAPPPAPAQAPALPPPPRRKVGLAALLDDCEETAALSAAQRRALHTVATGKNVFVTGRAGCGKSFFIKTLVRLLRRVRVEVEVVAPTGIAAHAVGGNTIHSFAGLDIELDVPTCIRNAFRYKKEDLRRVKVIVIDEISMVSAELLETFITVLKAVRGGMATPHVPLMVLCGDFLQLPPVSGTALLGSEVWASLRLTQVVLRDAFRQATDPLFVSILDEARMGRLSPAALAALQGRVGAVLACTAETGIQATRLFAENVSVDAINAAEMAKLPGARHRFQTQVFHGVLAPPVLEEEWESNPLRWPDRHGPSVHNPKDILGLSRLCTYWQIAPNCRKVEPQDLPASMPRGAEVFVPWPRRPGDCHLPCLQLTNGNIPGVLELALGAQVIVTKNMKHLGLLNGTRAIVSWFSADGLPVITTTDGRQVVVPPVFWTKKLSATPPSLVPPSKKRTASSVGGGSGGSSSGSSGSHDATLSFPEAEVSVVLQVPLRLAWSITIHKAQGMSLDAAEMDLGRTVRTPCQAYVALSRVRTLEGLRLSTFDPKCVFADPVACELYKAAERDAGDETYK